MASESVKILIEADDRASAKFKKVNKEMEASAEKVREVGGKAKASTELVGSLANSLGGSAIGGFAGEIAGLTERISAFSEVSKAGGAGALAFKAGLAGVVGVIGFKFGNMIGNAIFQTERWNRELENALEKNRAIADELEGRRGAAFDEEIAAIKEIAGLEERRAAAKAAVLELAKNMATPERHLAELQKQIASRENAYFHSLKQVSGEYRAHHEIMKAQAEELRSRASAEQKRKQQLLLIAVGEAENLRIQKEQAKEERQRQGNSETFVQGLRDELELMRATKEERFAIEAARGTANTDDRSEAERLLRERDAIQAKQQAEKVAAQERKKHAADRKREADKLKRESEQEQKRAADKRQREAKQEQKRAEDLRIGLAQKFREEAIAMQKGKVAARAYALQIKGLGKMTAKRVAMAEIKDGPNKGGASKLQAKVGRLLTRGGNVENKTERNTAETVAQLRNLAGILENQAKARPIQLKVASAS